MSEQVNISKVIELVNQARAVLGLAAIDDLPKGECALVSRCPLAKALRSDENPARIFPYTVGFNSERAAARVSTVWNMKVISGRVRLPDELREFIHAFDEHLLPQYEEGN